MTTAATPKATAIVQSLQTIELQSRTKATHKVAVQAGQAIQIVVDGLPYTGQKKIKDKVLILKRKGQSLLLIAEDQNQPLLEVSGFYAPDGTSQNAAPYSAASDTSAQAEPTPVDALALLQEGSRTTLAAAAPATSLPTSTWGTLVAQANTTSPATSTASASAASSTVTAPEAASDLSGGTLVALGLGALALGAAGGGGKSGGSTTSVTPVDTTPPTVALSSNATGTAKGDITYTFKFSEAVIGFDASKVTVANGTKGAFTPVSATEYTLVVTPMANAKGILTVSVASAGVKDAAGNALGTVPDATQAFDTVVVTPPPVDTTAPTAVVTDNAPGTASGPVTYTIAFSEAVKGFDASKLTLTGGTLSGFAANADGKTFTVVATPDLSTTGILKLSLSPSGVADLAGNAMASAPAVADQAYAQNLLQGTIVAGPVIGTNSLSVKVFNPSGQAIGTASVSPTGSYKVAVGSYTGPVAVLVIDTDDTKPDYVDEVSKKPTDLSGNLLAAGVVSSSTNAQTFNINPITTVAALKAGFQTTADGTGLQANTDTAISTKIDTANTAVAKALGLGTASDLLTTTITPTVNADGSTNTSANTYGKLLAMVSGMDKANGGDASKTISSLVSGISDSGTLSSTVQTAVKQGASEAGVPVSELPATATGGTTGGTSSGGTTGGTSSGGTTGGGGDTGVTSSIDVSGALSAGKAMAGITITAYNAAGEAVASAVTDANGQYALKISAQYAGQSLLLKASDTSADGQGYIDEATGESKDFSVSLRAMVQLGTDTTQAQKAQISTATELATRVLGIGDNNSLTVTKAQIQAANNAVAKFLGVSDIVNTDAPDVVGKGDSSNTTSDAYGKGLALLSGMDAVAERGGASNATGAALDKLASAFTLNLTGSVVTDFNDPELLDLLSQAVTEVAQTQGSVLAQDLAGIALSAVASQSSGAGNAPLVFFMTSSRNLIGDGKTTTVQLHFDSAPTADQITTLTSALGTTGGSLGALSQDGGDTSGKTWTTTFTQSGTDAPQISVSGKDYFANDLSMVLDNTPPTLSVVRMEGLDGTTGTVKTTVKAGDTLSVTLSASEAVNVSEGGTLQLSIGGQTVNASYNAAKSGTRSLVFDYTVGNNLSDTQGVSVLGLTGTTIQDMADNAADLSLNGYNGLPVYVDTTAPVVLAQVPIDNSIVGNAGVHSIGLSFGEAVSKGTSGTITLKNSAGSIVATWNAADAIVSADERSVSYALPSNPATLPAGAYTIEATGSPIADKAGNTISTSALTSDGVWSFTVGAVSIGIDNVGGDNLLNANDLKSDITVSGSLRGEGSTNVTASDMQVWLQPIGGGTAVQAKVNSLSSGNWSATLTTADAASLKGGYVVKVNIDAADVQASATSALMVDTQAQITLGAVAGDNKISLTEQSIINTGKDLIYSFATEKGSGGSITFQGVDAATSVVKSFNNVPSSAIGQVTLNKADLAKLGTGNFTVKATVTDVAGNIKTVSQAFSIEAPATAAQISSITLQGSRSGTLIEGDTLTAAVNFDKTVTVSNAASLKLTMDVGGTARQADFAGLSADRKQLLFSYKVVAADADGDGVALNANALQLGTGTSKAVINDVALVTAATITSSPVNAIATLKVNGSVTQTPADLALNVIEAGLTAANTPTAGKATANGKLLAAVESADNKTITKAQFGNNSEVTITAQGADVQGSYGKWTIKSDGSYTYTLDNGAANSLKAADKPTETLKFWVGAATTASEASVTIQGSNDAPVLAVNNGSTAIIESNTAASPVSVNLLQGASDVDGVGQASETTTLSVTGLTYKVGAGIATSTAPAGLSLSADGKTLSIDPASSAFDSLAAGATQTIVVSYNVQDAQGATVKQSATLTITGTNDAPTVGAALAQDASEGAGLSSINLLQGAKDADTGDTLSVSNVTYTVAGTATGSNGADLPAGVTLGTDGLLRLDTRHTAYDSMKAGETKDIVALYTLSDGHGGSVAQTATFTLTGTNDAPQVNTAKALLGATATAGSSVSYSVDANAFTDPEGDTLSYRATLADGSALPTWLNFDKTSRSFSGTAPASSTASQLSIQVKASDGSTSPALSASQTFTLAISPTGAPVAVVDKASVIESGIDASGNAAAGTASATGNVLTNDTHADSATVSVTAASTTTATSLSPVPSSTALTLKGLYGSLSLQADGSYTYTLDNTAPATQRLKAGQVVSDVFTYQLKDSTAQTAQSQLVVQVTGSNDAPVLSTSVTAPTMLTLASGKAFAYTMPTGLFTDPDADALSLSAVQVTGSATTNLPTWLKFDPISRTLSGTPAEGTAGSTTVRISASDGKGGAVSQDITLTPSLPTAPVAAADASQVVEAGISPTGASVGQGSASGNVLSNDSRAASSFSVTSADVGTLTGTTALKPISANSSATTLTGTYGSLQLGADGSYSYQLNNDASAVQALNANDKVTDTFTYELTDSTNQKARAQLTVTVNGSNDAPTISANVAITQATTESNTATTPVSINLLQGASDVDAGETDSLRVTGLTCKIGTAAISTTLPPGLSLSTDGKTLMVDPASKTFDALAEGVKLDIVLNYLVKDVNGASVAQKATLTVTGTNDAPAVSAAITQAVTESNTTTTPVSIKLLQGVSDVDMGDTLSVTGIRYKVGDVATSNNGADLPAGVTLSTDGKTLSVDPASTAFNSLKSGATQTITANYSVSDGKGGSVPQTVTLTVTGTNDAPTAQGVVGTQTAIKGQAFSLDASHFFTDVDQGDTLSYALSGVGASGLQISSSGQITGNFNSVRDTQNVTVTATDGSKASTRQSFDLRVVDQLAVKQIYASEVAPAIGKAGDTLRLVVEFSEGVTIAGKPTLTLNVNGSDVLATFDQMVSVDNLAYFTATVPTNNGNAISVKTINLGNGASVQGNATGTSLLTTAVNQSTSSYLVDNTAPDITTTELRVSENSTAVGTLSARDASTVRWTMADSGTDNSAFTLTENGALSFKSTTPDYESSVKSYSIKVKATDAVGLSSEKTLTVQVTDVNEAPTVLALNNTVNSLQENTSTTARVKVADIAITDDALGVNTLTLDGADKAFFEIDANALYLKAGTVLNYESGKTQYAVTVKAQDNALTFSTALSQDFSLSVTNVNEAPVASALSTQTIGIGQSWSGYTVPAFTDAENDTLSYTATLGDGSALPSWLSFDSNTRSFSIKDGSSTSSLSATNLSVKVSAYDGSLSTSATFSLNVTADTTPPTASSEPAEAPRSYDRAVLQGNSADTVMLRFSESVKVADIKAAMAQGQIKLQDSNGTLHSLGNGAVLDAYTPSSVLVSGLGSGVDGTYTSTYNSATGTSPAVNFANGFGLSSPNNFTVNTSTTIYTRTASDGTQWYIWQQNGWSSWMVSQSSPVDGNGNALPWFLAGTSSSTDPASRTAVLGVSGWISKAGALTEGADPWANASKLSSANIETQGYGRTFLLALGTGSTAQAGDVLVIDKGSVKDVAGNAASTDVQFTLPADITRPTVSVSTPATLVGLDAQGHVKTDALVIGDKVRVTLTLAEPVSVSNNADPSVSLLLDAFARQASINRAESFKNGAITSTTLVFDYTVKEGDADITGGIQLGAYNRNNSNLTDAAGNRFIAPTDLAEVSNSIGIAADHTAPTVASIYSADRGILNTGTVADTISFKFNEPIKVDQLEQAFTNGLVKVTSADGTVTRNLGAGATVEATYPSDMVVTGFSAQANGTYKPLWSSSQGQNVGLPTFNGFSYVSGVSLTPDPTYPVYKHIDSATGQEFYFWRPSGIAGYVLTPVNSVTGADAQTWWSASTSQTTVSQAVPREGVLLAADWYARSGTSTSATKLSAMPALDATGAGFTFSLSLGTGSNVQQGDKLVFDKSAVADLLGNSPSSDIGVNLPADITRPAWGTATVKGMKWGLVSLAETTDVLKQGDVIRVEIPVNETVYLYTLSGSAAATVALDMGGQTRYATLNPTASSATGSTNWGFTSNKLVFDYEVKSGDTDTQGGITIGAMSRGAVGIYDAASNRPVMPADVLEASNTITVNAADTTPPVAWASYASGNTVVWTANEALDMGHLPPASAFKVFVNGVNNPVTAVTAVTGNAGALNLTVANALTAGQDVNASYTDPSTNNDVNALQDLAGNDMASMQANSYYWVKVKAAPSIRFAQTDSDLIHVFSPQAVQNGGGIYFSLSFNDSVDIQGTPRLVLSLVDGTSSKTVYANFQPYSGVTGGQTAMGFLYQPADGDKGQYHVTGLDLNGGSISAFGSAGQVSAIATLNGSEFFTPQSLLYSGFVVNTQGSSGNDLLTPWLADPSITPHTLTASSANGGAGDRDALLINMLLPSSVTTAAQAQAYSLSYNVAADGTRQVLLKNGSAVVDTYTVPSNTDWPTAVEQLVYGAVFKDSTNSVQSANMEHILLSQSVAEYTDPVNANDRWVQGSLGNDMLDYSTRDTAQRLMLRGGPGNDTIKGHAGTDIVMGDGGNNTISTGAGDDQIVVGRGNDTIDGGDGIDSLILNLSGNNAMSTLDAAGVVHVYTAMGNWNTGYFVPDAAGWVERYRIGTNYQGGVGVNDLSMVSTANPTGRVASAIHVEKIEARLDNNDSGRVPTTLGLGTAGNDAISGADVVLAGAGDDTITLNADALHTYDWQNGNRPLLIDGGAGRDVLTLDGTSFYGYLNQAFEHETGNNINASRVIKNIEGLNFTGNNTAYSTVALSAADITNLYAADDTSTNAWSEIINSPGKRQFKIDGAVGLNITDTSGWTLQTNTVSYGGVTYKIADHSSGVELILDSRIGISGGLSNGGFSGGPTVPDFTLPTTLSIASDTTNGTIVEGNSGTTPVTFTVKRSGNTAGTSAVAWNLVSTETDSSDFAPGQTASGTLSFAAGESSKTIIVNVQGDTAAELNEKFGIRLSGATGATLNFAETQVTINNDDGEYLGNGPAPTVTLVRTDTKEFVGPDDSLHFVVELDQAVTVSGTPRLALTLTDPTGAQRTVYADFVRYSDANGTWNQQSSMEFVYHYGSADAVGAGWTYHINALENANGSSIMSVESASINVPANLALKNVAITSGTWLYTSEVNGTTGTANNDGLFGFEAMLPAGQTVPHALTTSSADGGAGDRDLLGIPVLLPSSVTTLAQAQTYYLNYEVTTDSNGNATARTVKLYQQGNSAAVDSYSVPLSKTVWPTNVEALAYYLKFKDTNGVIQDTDQPNDSIVFWKEGYTSVDAVNGDITRQGSYLSDTIDLSATGLAIPTATRTFVRGNQGNDTLTGHDGTDVLFGDGGNDVVNAGAGNDMVALGGGADTLDGGAGTDILAMWVKGQDAKPNLTADGKLQVLSAFGTWGNNSFTPDSNGYQPDWTLDFNGQTGAISAQHAGSTDVSTATNFEKMRIYPDQYLLVHGDTTGTFDVLVGTDGNDTLVTTSTQGILAGLDGDDTITVNSSGLPVLLGGAGNDTFVFGNTALQAVGSGENIVLHGGAGTDTLSLGTDVSGVHLYRHSDGRDQVLSMEALDLTGSTVNGALGNSVSMTAQWLREMTDAASTRTFTVKGDANDRVNLLTTDNWAVQQISDQTGYALYQTTYQSETLKLYVANAMAAPVMG